MNSPSGNHAAHPLTNAVHESGTRPPAAVASEATIGQSRLARQLIVDLKAHSPSQHGSGIQCGPSLKQAPSYVAPPHPRVVVDVLGEFASGGQQRITTSLD